jgi:hypothetical protein
VGTLGQPLLGYASFTPAEIFQETTTQGVQRFIGSVNANWRPLSWLANRGNIGLDLTDRTDYQLMPRGRVRGLRAPIDWGLSPIGRARTREIFRRT